MLKAYEISNLFHLRSFPYPAPSEKPNFTANIPLKMGMTSFFFGTFLLVLQKKTNLLYHFSIEMCQHS